MAVYKRGRVWWYKFTFNGEAIRESTKQTNKRTAEQMEAAHKAALAKGEVGIRDRKPVPTLKQFAEGDFLPFVRSTFAAKSKTQSYYEYGVKSLLAYEKLAGESLDRITTERISGYVVKRQAAGLEVSSINRELQALRRMFALAVEWGKVDKALPRVRMLPGEKHRERVLTREEEARYLASAKAIGDGTLEGHRRALEGIRAIMRGEHPMKPSDPYLLRDVATILLDCGMRPEECFRLKWENLRDGNIEILTGKTDNARRRIPLSERAAAIIEMRRASGGSEWVFPASTRSGHIEPSTLKKQHLRACRGGAKPDARPVEWDILPFPLYTFRHTCLTRWAPHMDPWTLAHLAGHRDMSITRRYVHPQDATVRAAMERAQNAKGGHNFGHSEKKARKRSIGEAAVIK
jgi:integrase